MDYTTLEDHLLTALHRVLGVGVLLVCLLAEVFIFASKRHAAFYGAPLCATLLVYVLYRRGANPRIYLVDFACLTPPRHLRVPLAKFVEHLKLMGGFDDESVEFMATAAAGAASGMGDETYLPAPLHFIPPEATHSNALAEARATLLFPTLDVLFARTRVAPSAVCAVVVSCSGLCPAPSLAAAVAARYRMRGDVRTINLSGMGCSAGVVGVDVARGVLLQRRGAAASYAVAVCMEALTVGWYGGRERSKLLLNCFFRTGCSAALLTNKAGGANNKYRLVRLARTNRSADDESYRAGYREEDDQGVTGFHISRGVGRAFEDVLRAHLLALGASVLPWSEKLRYALHLLLRRRRSASTAVAPSPSFRTAADHFCLPTTWRPMIRRLGQGLGLGDADMEPALMTFHRFGNQSAASLWYQLAYLEAKGKVREGHKVWQLGVGSGLKVNSVLWEALHHGDTTAPDHLGPWRDCLHRYPVPE